MNNIIAKVYELLVKIFYFFASPILKFLNKIPLDKKLHFLVGYLFASIAFLILATVPMFSDGLRFWEVTLLSFFLTLFPAVGKEIYDLKIDVWDIFFTLAGGLFASIVSLLLVIFI